jgi:hypothetical protein
VTFEKEAVDSFLNAMEQNMGIVTNAKKLNADIAAMIEDYIATKGVTRAEDVATAKGTKLPKTKHAGKANYGMRTRRYA